MKKKSEMPYNATGTRRKARKQNKKLIKNWEEEETELNN